MFKRTSILVRRSEDVRESFAAKWEHHGTLVSQLPFIRTYVQNHVVEELTPNGPFDIDGIVELRFDRPEDMTAAFTSPNAVAVKEDEPGFLGHGTGYALRNDNMPLISPQGAKLIFVLANVPPPELLAAILSSAGAAPEFRAAARDDVATVIGRPEMKRPPQNVSTFLHLLFDDPQQASAAGRRLAGIIAQPTSLASIVRVRTTTVI